jgi:hypothetical protein
MAKTAAYQPTEPIEDPAASAAEADSNSVTTSSAVPKATSKKPATPAAGNWFARHRQPLLFAAAMAVLVGGGVGAWWLTRPGSAPSPLSAAIAHRTSPSPSPSPATLVAPLTGLQVAPELAQRPVSAVVIENHPDARPQSGLQDAGVVYEANAEGGITRFLAFFQDNRPASLGPVRSLRTYFVDWALEFNAPVAHAGGNADALDLVKPLGMKDLNALSSAAGGFFRTTDRYAPHNLYTTSDRLDTLLKQFGFGAFAPFAQSPRKADAPNANAPHPKIHIEYSYSGYQVDYTYDPTTNDYARNMAGAPHVDRNTGKQIHVKNVVVQMMPTSYGFTRIGEDTVIMKTVGRGQGWVMRDGDVVPITWVKDSHSARTKLLDAAGKDVPLDPGNTWYSIVPTGKTVSF